MIPEGWQSVPLAKIAKSKIVYGIVQAGPHDPQGVPYLKSSDIGGQIDCANLQRTAPDIHRRFGRSTVVPGDIVISLRGNIGDTSIVPDDLAEANLTQGTARISVGDDFDRDFIFLQLSSFDVQRRIHSVTKGSTFVEITLEDLRKIEVPVPESRKQQRYIADVLLDWDRAIETVEALIGNARAQQQALMQHLLPRDTARPRNRLPGFKGEWRELSLEALARVVMGSSPPSSAYNDAQDGLPLIQGNADIENRRSCPRLYTSEITQTCEPNDILFSVRAPVGEISVSRHHACIGRGIAAIRPRIETDADFLYFRLLAAEANWARLSQGSTFQAVNSRDLKGFTIHVPNDEAERQAIGVVLRRGQFAEDSLQSQLTALRQEKAALMQQLLTGKRRVKLDQKEAA